MRCEGIHKKYKKSELGGGGVPIAHRGSRPAAVAASQVAIRARPHRRSLKRVKCLDKMYIHMFMDEIYESESGGGRFAIARRGSRTAAVASSPAAIISHLHSLRSTTKSTRCIYVSISDCHKVNT